MIKWVLKRTLLNWKYPFYSQYLYEFSKRYLDLWYGDNNFDRETNGEYRLLAQIIPRSKLVIDVGANIGVYSAEMLRDNPAIKIHAFEPDPDSFKKLQALPVTANNIALGEIAGTHILYKMPRSTHNSFYTEVENIGSIEVPVSTLDTYCSKNSINAIDFIKIDVEGHEYFVLEGAKNILSRGIVDYVQFEFSGATADARVFLKDFITLFNKYGYDLYRIRATDVQLVDYYPDRERFTLTNYLAIRHGVPIP